MLLHGSDKSALREINVSLICLVTNLTVYLFDCYLSFRFCDFGLLEFSDWPLFWHNHLNTQLFISVTVLQLYYHTNYEQATSTSQCGHTVLEMCIISMTFPCPLAAALDYLIMEKVTW